MALGLASCTHDLGLIDESRAVALTTTGPWASMIYLARTDSGLIVIDLGWVGAERTIKKGLARLGADASDVKFVFLTHAHDDHTYGWRYFPGSAFVLGGADVDFFTGKRTYRELLPRIGNRLGGGESSGRGSVRIIDIGSDTSFVLGADTLRAFRVPGHTPGSMAYEFRKTLFMGDAINWRPWTGFRGTRREFSENEVQSRASILDLFARLDSSRVRTACSSHAKCARFDDRFRRAVLR
jgi:glyoxylase-like metal-dependent hydrolase (beta-lactamase superfamily II)